MNLIHYMTVGVDALVLGIFGYLIKNQIDFIERIKSKIETMDNQINIFKHQLDRIEKTLEAITEVHIK